ncbi:MAG: A24 family peptidase C-terminal domain-containing protein [Nitrososphaeraceae archaeon]
MFEFLLDAYTIRIVLAMIMLSIASLIDIWKREINDVLWIGFAAIAVVLILIEPDLIDILKNIGISLIIAPVVLIMWRVGIFGGADALGLMVLAALAPLASFSGGLITPFTTLTNAAIISVIPIFTNAVRNIIALLNHNDIFEGFDETRSKKTLAIFLGYRAKNPKYSFSIETTEGNRKKLDFSLKHAEKAEFCNTPDTWITPGIPYILYITSGFVVQIVFGDIVLNALSNFW